MKKNHLVLLSVLSALAFIPTAFAAVVCPTVPQIQAAGLAMVEKDDVEPYYFAGQISNYGQPNAMWGFVIRIPASVANSPEDALNKGRALLPALSGPNPATPIPYEGQFVCLYALPNGYEAGAITLNQSPALTKGINKSMSKAVRFKK